jgi:hypothetical protein
MLPYFVMNKQERIKRREVLLVLYGLERKYGVPADLYKITVGEPNLETGRPDTTRIKYHTPKMVTHTVSMDHKFDYDIAFLAANKNFTYGGFYAPGDRIVIVRNTWGLTEVTLKDWIIYDDKRYSIERVVTLDYRVGWILHLRHTPGVTPYQIHDKVVWSRVTPDHDMEGTL